MRTYLSDGIESAGIYAQYDGHVKRLLKDRNVLACILTGTVKEFQGYSMKEAADCIEKEPEVSSRPVMPAQMGKIFGSSTESTIPGEGSITYDIVFTVYTKDKERVKLYVNVEAQNSFYPGYDLVTRGVFYGARLLSEQMDKEFTPKNYDGIKKVYSIWICMNAPQNSAADSITEYSIQPNAVYGDYTRNDRYDLLSVVMICLSRDTVRSENALIGMLSNLLSAELPVEKKKEMMEEQYGLPMSAEMESEVSNMCNLSYGIAEAAAAEAREKATAEVAAKYEKILEQTVAENTINILASLVRDHLLDVPEAAKRAGLSVSEFNKRMGN